MCLFTFQNLFRITAKLSDVLQAEKLDFAGAAGYIEATVVTLKALRTTEEWKIWENATKKAAVLHVYVESPRPVKNRKLPARLQGSILSSETVGNQSPPMEEYRVQLYYATIDIMVGEIEARFDSVNLPLMKAMQTLTPKSAKFLDFDTLVPFLSHYSISPVKYAQKCLQLNKCLHQEMSLKICIMSMNSWH